MTDTLPNIAVGDDAWVDLYAQSGLSVGQALRVENIGAADVYVCVQATQPDRDHNAYTIVRRWPSVAGIIEEGASGAWAFCPNQEGLLNVALYTASGGGPVTDQFVKVSANDTSAGYAEDKIVKGTGIQAAVLNEGGNEQLQISLDPSAINTGNVTYGVDVEHLDTLQEFINHAWSAGSGAEAGEFDLTENGDGTVDITGGAFVLRSADSDTAELKPYQLAGVTNLALVDEATNYLLADYNNGSPQIVASTTLSDVLAVRTKTVFYAVNRLGNHLNVIDLRSFNVDFIRKNSIKDYKVHGFEHASGNFIADLGSRNILITAGEFYLLNQAITAGALDTSAAGTFEYVYRDGAGGWTRAASQTQIDNANYDDGTGVLNSLGNNKYAAAFVYSVLNSPSHYKVVYGRAQHDQLSGAQAEGTPATLPSDLNALSTAVFIGKIIVRQGVDAFQDIQSPFVEVLSTEQVNNHQNLSGLQGGDVDEYYHLTAAQETGLTGGTDTALHFHASDRNRINHTGTQMASTISDFGTEVSNNTDVAANTTHRTSDGSDHTFINQDVTSSGSPTFANVSSTNNATANSHLVRLDQVNSLISGLDWQQSVLDILATPPGSPTTGDRYIVDAVATGAWVGREDDIAEWNGASWDFYTPEESWTLWVQDVDTNYTFNGSAWVEFGSTVSHNNTTGLQGGAVGDYQHLTTAQVALVAGALQNIVEDTTPQLGGDLDVNGNDIASTGDIDLKLGDAAGANFLNIKDSADVAVVTIDSDGSLSVNNVTTAGAVTVNDDTNSTASTNGSIQTAGGLGVERDTNLGGRLDVGGNFNVIDGFSTMALETSDTNKAKTVAAFVCKSTGDMTDGHGINFNFRIEDDTSGTKVIGRFNVVRDGADNQGAFTIKAGINGNQDFLKCSGSGDNIQLKKVLHIENIKSGATQAAAGAAQDEVWKTSGHATLPDNVLLIGV